MSDTPYSSDDEQNTELTYIPPDLITDEFSDISPSSNRTILKKIIKQGTGRSPLHGDTVYVHYTGTLPNGTKFDSSRDRDQLFSFKIGEGKVIKSWDMCLRSMQKGEECLLLTAAKYAYGSRGTGNHEDERSIPPNSALCFKIELFDFSGEDVTPEKNGLVLRSVISSGFGYLVPRDWSKVKISYKVTHKNEIIGGQDEFEFEIGRANEKNLVEGIEFAVRYMRKGERAIFVMKYPLSCRILETDDVSNYPKDHVVEYDITLIDFEIVKQFYDMDYEEKLNMVDYVKKRGNELLGKKCYKAAFRCYESGKKYVEDWETDKVPAEQLDSMTAYSLSLKLNMSLTCLRLEQFKDAFKYAEEALGIDSSSNKGLWRAAKALSELEEFDKALEYLRQAEECGVNCEEVEREMRRVCGLRETYRASERALYKNALSKIMAE